jgi:hypothetical protein
MKIRIILSVIFLIAVVFTGCEKSNDEINNEDVTTTLKKKPKAKPFKIIGLSTRTGGEPGCDGEGSFSVEYEGIGNASHMGRVTYTGKNCQVGECMEGRIGVRAANGDSLYLVGGEGYTMCGEFVPPNIIITGPGYIDGGTGRFEGAGGELEWYLVLVLEEGNPDFGKVRMNAKGTIIY